MRIALQTGRDFLQPTIALQGHLPVMVLCHNLTCLIQEQETLGIAPIFWDNADAGEGEPTVFELHHMGRIRLLVVLVVVATVMVLLSPALFRVQMDAARTKDRWDKREVRQR